MALKPPAADDTARADAGLAELYRAVSTEEPRSRLDAAICAAARSAGERSASRPMWWVPWRVPFAVAAVAVVSGSLALLMYEERPETLAEAPAPSIALPPPTPVPAPSQERTIAQQSVPAEPSASVRREPDEKLGALQAQRPRALAKEMAAADAASSREMPAEAKLQARQDSVVPSPPPTGPSASTEMYRKQERAAVSGNIGIRGLEARDLAGAQQAPESGVASSAPARAAPAAPAAPAAMAAPAPAEARGRSEARSGTGADITSIKAELEREPPARWVERIASLRRAGRHAEADALAAEFRRRFPDEPLPTPP